LARVGSHAGGPAATRQPAGDSWPPVLPAEGSLFAGPPESRHERIYRATLDEWEDARVRVGWDETFDLNCRALVFSDQASGDTFEVQCAIEWDDQDRELGQDTYCLVRGGAAHYGGLLGYQFLDGNLVLKLQPSASVALDLPEEFGLSLDPDQEELVRSRLPGLLPTRG
jgi:Immunity protein 10